MANVNEVVFNGNTLISLKNDTATAADVAQGKTFHLASGESATGTASGGGGSATFVRLWVNPSPYAAFAIQTIELDLSEYDFVLVRGKCHATNCTVTEDTFDAEWKPSSDLNQALVPVNDTQGFIKLGGADKYTRGIKVSSTGILFGGVTSNYTSYQIPLSVYGVKGSFST